MQDYNFIFHIISLTYLTISAVYIFNLKKNNQALLDDNHKLEIEKSVLMERIKNVDNLQEEILKHTKSSLFETANLLSSKLIEDHKKESEFHKKQSEEIIQKTTVQLTENFKKITENITILSNQVQKSSESYNIIHQALLNPSSAGNLAEITLENILRSSGLIKGHDYLIQYSVTDETVKFRPDAVIFMPGDNIIIIDSKASKFFLESHINEKDLDDKLVSSMKNHLKSLSSKDYKEKVTDYLKKSGKTISHVTTIMFLPSDASLEKLLKLDPEIMQKAMENNIFLSGPAGIINILYLAKFHINESKQIDNHMQILDEVKKLIGSLNVIYEHARKLAQSLNSTVSHYNKFAGSFNNNLIAKARKLKKLGIESSKNSAEIPNLLEKYQIISADSDSMIEIEVETRLEQEEV